MAEGWSVKELSRENWAEAKSILEPFDAIIHAAGDVRLDPIVSMRDFINSNLTITIDLLELCKRTKASHFVFISSCAVYGDLPVSLESSPCDPKTLNGKIKLLNESLISEFCCSFDIQFSCLRLFNLVGGKDNFSIIYHIRESIRKNHPFLLRNNGQSKRDFIHVADAAALIVPTIANPKTPPILNIGSSKAIPVGSIVEFAQRLHPELKIKHEVVNEIACSYASMEKYRLQFGEFQIISVLENLPNLLTYND